MCEVHTWEVEWVEGITSQTLVLFVWHINVILYSQLQGPSTTTITYQSLS